MKIAFLTPRYSTDMKAYYDDSLIRTQWPKGAKVSHFRDTGVWTPKALFGMTKSALEWGADFLFMVSADVGWNPDAVVRLVSHNVHVVGGWASGRTPPFLCHVADTYNPKTRLFRVVTHPEERRNLENVAAVGGEMVCWSRKLFSILKSPWFFGPKMIHGEVFMTEDYYMYEQCWHSSIPVYVDWDVPLYHGIDGVVTYKGQLVAWQKEGK